MVKSVFITGGTGLIGSKLVKKLVDDNAAVTVLTRNARRAKQHLPDATKLIENIDALQDLNEYDAVINLAGEPIVNKRWSQSQKQKLQSSRWDITNQLVTLCNSSSEPPGVFISGSAVGFYGRQDDTPIDESFEDVYPEYSHQLCKTWENIALKASSPKTRVCLLRTGIVLAPNEGALAKMSIPFKLGIGGPIGNGEHYMSWIHIDDMVDGIRFLLSQPESKGVYNFTAPKPVTNTEFSTALARALNRPCLIPTPKFVLKIAMGEMADLMIYGQNVVPKHLQQDGFKFVYPEVQEALYSLDL